MADDGAGAGADLDVTLTVLSGDRDITDARRIQERVRRIREAQFALTAMLAAFALITSPVVLAFAIAIWMPGRGVDIGMWDRESAPLAAWKGRTTGTIRIRPTGILLDHPTLLGALHVTRADLRCFAVDDDPDRLVGEPGPWSFKVLRQPGYGYHRWEPRRVLDIPLLCLDQDLARPDAAILFDRPIDVRAIAPPGGATASARPRMARPRSLMGEGTAGLPRSRQVVRADGVFLWVDDPARLRAALLAIGLREGITADDVPGAPPHRPLPEQGGKQRKPGA